LTEPAPFAARLLAWWDEHGRHDLPWQHPRTPYRVWVAEIMLQQTQVATAIPYFERFMERFPDIGTLAAASLDAVLAGWSGLGYYARARNLHAAARICVERHGASLPTRSEGLAALPGIGLSTAHAIVSQAHDRPAPVLDGNVRRVLARHAAIEGWPGAARVSERLWQLAESLLPQQRGADYTQAIMDLGATLCTRRRPRCTECPVRGDCRALLENRVEELPAPKPSARVRLQHIEMLVLQRADGRILLQRRPTTGIWGGLWSLPEAGGLTGRLDLARADLVPLPEIEHRLTHRLLKIRPLRACPESGLYSVKWDDTYRWFAATEWRSLGMPRPVADLLTRFEEGAKT